jgi:hypothetical protein
MCCFESTGLNIMTVTIELTADEEAQLQSKAARAGLAPTDYVKNLILSDDVSLAAPNELALEALRRVAEIQAGMPESSPSLTDQLIRSGRSGGIYGDSLAG